MSTQKQDKEPEKHECPEGQVWNHQEGKCVTKAQLPTEKLEQTGLVKDLAGFFEDLKAYIEKRATEIVDERLETLGPEVTKFLRKAVGMDEDPALTVSQSTAMIMKTLTDHPEIIRKALLETSESDKRTPGKERGGPEGTLTEPTGVDAIFKSAEERLKR